MSEKVKTSDAWPEIKRVMETKRYELILVGPEISKRIEDNNGCLDPCLFTLKNLNLLEVAKTKLTSLPMEIKSLHNLTSLLCHTNELSQIPVEIGLLEHLKYLDLSNNKLTKLPDELKNLKELFTLNLSGNQLDTLFPFDDLKKLSTVDISRNKFQQLPGDIGNSNLENLQTIDASYNELVELPDNLADLPSIKTMSFNNNKITAIPFVYGKCNKLKELNMKENKLKDNRLKKLIEQDKMKAIFEYLEKAHDEENKNKPKSTSSSKSQSAKNGNKNNVEPDYDLIKVLHFNDKEMNSIELILDETVSNLRPFIICAILRNVDLETPGNYKKFLNIQNKIHDETCAKRTLATIATHDLNLIKEKLFYEASAPNSIQLVPLGRKNPIFADEYYEKLMEEAEAERKAKKRNQLSGIYKYLSLLENKEKFVYIRDSDCVISLPPLTNAEKTRITTSTTNILIEITSTVNYDTCKKVIETLLLEMINNRIASKPNLNDKVQELNLSEGSQVDGPKIKSQLLMQQVKAIDTKGNLKNVYPSRIDLNFEDSNKLRVVRTYDEQ